jgi:Tfp pilus assembly protein PilW
MIDRRFRAFRKSDTRSFTLVELLVAIAITGFILVAMFTMISMADSVWRQGIGRVDNFTRARAMLDLIAGDVEGGVFRPDLPAFGTLAGTDTFAATNGIYVLSSSSSPAITNAFYTRRAGVGSNVRDLSLVIYSLTSATNAALNRSYLSVPWTPPAAGWSATLPFQNNLPSTAATAMDTAEGVVGFEMLFMRSDGTLTNAYSGYQAANPVVGVVAGLAVVDTPTLQFLNAQNKLTTLETSMATVLSGTNSPKAEWDASMAGSTFYQSYPESMRPGLKTFERSVYCREGF